MKKVTILLILLATCFSFGQDTVDINQMIIKGKSQIQTALDEWDVNKMINARGYFERLLTLEQSEELVHYYIGYADFRIVGIYFATDDLESSKKYIDDSIDHLEAAVNLDDNFAEAHILLSSMYGNKIAVKPILGMSLGMKSGSHAGKATKLSPANPRVAFLAGTNAYYTPRMFGGGKSKALKKFDEAALLFPTFKIEHDVDPDWGEADIYVYLGLVNLELKNYEAADKNLDTCLELKPGHGWALELKGQVAEAINNAE